jgi:hypothetical protein
VGGRREVEVEVEEDGRRAPFLMSTVRSASE